MQRQPALDGGHVVRKQVAAGAAMGVVFGDVDEVRSSGVGPAEPLIVYVLARP